jgi:hypothetical protein
VSDLSLSAADLRVFHRLKGEIDAFDLGMKPLPVIIESVGVLLDELTDVPPTFAEELRQLWWPQQYALALSRDQERELSGAEEQAVRDAVALLVQQMEALPLH